MGVVLVWLDLGMRHFHGIDDLQAVVGERLGTSAWHEVPQSTIVRFAEATEDFEGIHLDPAKARAAGLPDTIAHGLYTLSRGPAMLYEIYSITGPVLWLNYGFEKVRFLSPVGVGSRIRMVADLVAAEPITGGVRFTVRETFEIDGQGKPACVADGLIAYFHTLPPGFTPPQEG
ncbi:MAG: MaoC family dehydratase [Tetrasphaera sp.]